MFMSNEPRQRADLADMILSKIKEKETELASHFSGASYSLYILTAQRQRPKFLWMTVSFVCLRGVPFSPFAALTR